MTGEIAASAGEGVFRVWARGWKTDDGVVIGLFGGDHTHVGTVVLSVPRPSLSDPAQISSTSSVLNLIAHKEEDLVRPLAEEAARRLKRPVVAVSGIHVDGATKDQIGELCALARKAWDEVLEQIITKKESWRQ
ncbi:MAG: hypothetical protein M1598_07880 [Actinobacteria bacterium]|nr:hypothetical protein [Actinomycetota bacterium]